MSLIKLLSLMSVLLNLHAAQPACGISFPLSCTALHSPLKKASHEDCKESAIKDGMRAFGKKVEAESQDRIAHAIADIEGLSEGEDRSFWMKILNAYEMLDIPALESLQNEKKPESQEEQILIIDLICAVQSALDKQKSDVVISNMTDIKKGSFFKQITATENSEQH